MQIASIIKYEGSNNILVWKHPCEDFNTNTQLIVHQSQQAVVYYNGQMCDIFEAGRHTLTTENLPVLNKILSIPTDGETPFHCEVYFVNTVDSMDLMWGTPSPMLIKEPEYDIILPVGANGQFGVRIIDPKVLLITLVGTIDSFTQDTIGRYFKGLLLTEIRDELSQELVNKKISIFEINSYLKEISDEILENITNKFSQYGIKVVNFFVTSISVPEDNISYQKLKEALDRKAEMKIVGYDYQQSRTFDVLEKAASNEGTGASVMGAGLGLGMGVNMGNMVAGAMGGAISNVSGTKLNVQDTNTETTPPPCINRFCNARGNEVLHTMRKTTSSRG